VGNLKKAMYGKRAAPAEWQRAVRKTRESPGSVASKMVPCLHFNPVGRARVVVHVDDFMCTESSEDLEWLEGKSGKRFELTIETLGGEEKDSHEFVLLGRTSFWTASGLEIEVDPRHADVLIR